MQLMFPAWFAVGAVLAVMGVAAWVIQVRKGMGVTSLSNLRPWGSYVAGFIFFTGLSAGALVLAGLPLVIDLPAIRPYAGIAALVALAALIIGMIFIFVDIGRPSHVWRMFAHGNLRSPMMWDLILTVVYFIVGATLLACLLFDAPPSVLAVVGVVAVLAGVADGVTAFVFATQVARDYWLSAIQPIAFFVAALASAGAVIQLLVLGLAPSGYVKLDLHDTEPLAVMTALCVGLGLLFLVSEMATMRASRSVQSRRTLELLRTSPVLRIEVGSAIIAVALLLIPPSRTSAIGVILGSAATLIYLVAKRIHFVEMGFAIPNLELKGVNIDRGRGGSPLRRPVELSLTLGLAGGFIVLVSLGLTILPLSA